MGTHGDTAQLPTKQLIAKHSSVRVTSVLAVQLRKFILSNLPKVCSPRRRSALAALTRLSHHHHAPT